MSREYFPFPALSFIITWRTSYFGFAYIENSFAPKSSAAISSYIFVKQLSIKTHFSTFEEVLLVAEHVKKQCFIFMFFIG